MHESRLAELNLAVANKRCKQGNSQYSNATIIDGKVYLDTTTSGDLFNPCQDPEQGNFIIETERIAVRPIEQGWKAHHQGFTADGETFLIAAMLAYVNFSEALKLINGQVWEKHREKLVVTWVEGRRWILMHEPSKSSNGGMIMVPHNTLHKGAILDEQDALDYLVENDFVRVGFAVLTLGIKL